MSAGRRYNNTMFFIKGTAGCLESVAYSTSVPCQESGSLFFLPKSFTGRDKSRQAGGGPPEEGDGDRGEGKQAEHLRAQTAICRLQRGHLTCQSELKSPSSQDVCAETHSKKPTTGQRSTKRNTLTQNKAHKSSQYSRQMLQLGTGQTG